MGLIVKNLSFSYGDRSVLRDVSFSAEYGQVVSVLGQNGAGKSTLFRCMLGLLRPQRGEVRIDGESVAHMPARTLAQQMAYIPQTHAPAFDYSVMDMVLMGTAAQLGSFSAPGGAQRDRAEAALERLGIAALRTRKFGAISGGEQQLTLIARALAQGARALVMDEPSSSLDFGNRIRVMRTMRELAQDGCLVVQSTHDPDQAYRYSDRILALRRGRVLAWGDPGDVVRGEIMSELYETAVEVRELPGGGRICGEKDETGEGK